MRINDCSTARVIKARAATRAILVIDSFLVVNRAVPTGATPDKFPRRFSMLSYTDQEQITKNPYSTSSLLLHHAHPSHPLPKSSSENHNNHHPKANKELQQTAPPARLSQIASWLYTISSPIQSHTHPSATPNPRHTLQTRRIHTNPTTPQLPQSPSPSPQPKFSNPQTLKQPQPPISPKQPQSLSSYTRSVI